jgi:hypothetical protein
MNRKGRLPSTVALLIIAGCATVPRSPSPGVHRTGELGVARIWHGRTPLAKADEYEKYLYAEGIAKIRTLRGLRRDLLLAFPGSSETVGGQ